MFCVFIFFLGKKTQGYSGVDRGIFTLKRDFEM